MVSKLIYFFILLFGSLGLTNGEQDEVSYGDIFSEAFSQVELPSQTSDDLSLPSFVMAYGNDVYLEYIMSNSAISNNGKVTVGDKDVDVIIYCKASFYDKVSYKKLGVVTVKKPLENINIYMDMDELFVNYLVEFTLDDKYNREDFVWESSDPDILEIDEEYIGFCKKAGNVTVNVLDDAGNVVGNLVINVKNHTPVVKFETDKIAIGDEFEAKITNYKSIDMFDITIDNPKVIEYKNGKFIAKEAGVAEVTFTLKEDQSTFVKKQINVYSKNPEIFVSSTSMVVGTSLRIDVLNYERDEYIIEVDNTDIVTLNDNNIIGKQMGTVTITVKIKDDLTLYSTVSVLCTPILPEVVCGKPNVKPGDNTQIYIRNLDELISSNLDEYEVTNLTPDIIKIEGKKITSIKEGVGKFRVTLKDNSLVSSEGTINVLIPSNDRLPNGEISKGPLIVTLEGNREVYKIGEKIKVNVEGLHDPLNYKFISEDRSVINTLDDGHIIVKNEGVVTISVISKDNVDIRGSVTISVKGYAQVNYIERLIKVAEGELGYKELPTTETKYGIWYGIPDGDWCAMFVTWCAHYSGIDTTIIPFYCGCTAGWQWFIDNNCYGLKEDYIPKAGDIIFFLSNGAGHTGIVTGCDGKTVYTIEGNTSNMVARRSYPLDYSTITGYGIPNYVTFPEA